jgi:hypothetical protein
MTKATSVATAIGKLRFAARLAADAPLSVSDAKIRPACFVGKMTRLSWSYIILRANSSAIPGLLYAGTITACSAIRKKIIPSRLPIRQMT